MLNNKGWIKKKKTQKKAEMPEDLKNELCSKKTNNKKPPGCNHQGFIRFLK